ncbi:MAG TPA: 1-phosphofructokinase family hexose kinase, partial [Chitinophagaceae bacterium]|nr:1-phosphofructokinase family hexose kinase [Chitinophagaceae bacterium]
MASIITITLNPAIDKSTSIEALLPEKKLRCSPPVFEPGGGGINVARAIHKLGGKASPIYLAGGYTGKFFKQLLEEEGIESIIIEISKHTRENLIVLDRSANQQYRFGMPGPSIRESEWRELLTVLENQNADFIVASGSVPEGVTPDIFARIAMIARNKNSKFIVDTSGEPLKQALSKGVYLLKPNLGELASLSGRDHINENEAAELAKEIINKGQCEIIVVSMGPSGALLVTPDTVEKVRSPPVEKKSTVGAGDSMVAGIVWSLAKKKSLLESVQYGVASGTAATLNPGSELCRLEDVEK